MPDRILRMPDVSRATGLSRPTIYRKIAAADFPQPRALGVRSRGWLESEIQHWIATRRCPSPGP